MRYFDASALAKRYIHEEATPVVRRWLAAGRAATSRLSEVEIVSAFARRVREGTLAPKERDRAVAALVDDLAALHVVELSGDVAGEARALLARHALRAGDAIQLASGVELERALGQRVPFVVFDERLRAAAAAEGLTTLP